jgi:hypothetical protein
MAPPIVERQRGLDDLDIIPLLLEPATVGNLVGRRIGAAAMIAAGEIVRRSFSFNI